MRASGLNLPRRTECYRCFPGRVSPEAKQFEILVALTGYRLCLVRRKGYTAHTSAGFDLIILCPILLARNYSTSDRNRGSFALSVCLEHFLAREWTRGSCAQTSGSTFIPQSDGRRKSVSHNR